MSRQITAYIRGDIVYVGKSPAEEIGSEIHASRPAVVVSNDILNISSPVISVVYLIFYITMKKTACNIFQTGTVFICFLLSRP